mmetsp:Transcript_79897/g.185508  ORF Transcript_79897/g.185508 Transcript_79897/m.185508 type:complete len:334 (+) Transcript_79897:1-1002(+)
MPPWKHPPTLSQGADSSEEDASVTLQAVQTAPSPYEADPKLVELQACGERRAMQALARHTARLGLAGRKLEEAVRAALARAQGSGSAVAAVAWDFLDRKDGQAEYQALRQRLEAVYDRLGRCEKADKEVLGLLERKPAESGPTAAVAPLDVGSGETTRVPPALGSGPTCLMELPTANVRFAHNDQSERFGHGLRPDPVGGCLLQLAVELLTGLTLPTQVPEFTVCWHEGHWFCRSGNRRLAAFRLAQRFAPDRFARVRVRAVATDDAFVHGVNGKRPKLTTHQNGERCMGHWLVIRETGELVGGGRPGLEEYGADLLSLLPPAPEWFGGKGGA